MSDVIADNSFVVTERVTTRRNPIDRLVFAIPFGIGLAVWTGRGWRRAKRSADEMEREAELPPRR